MRYTIFNRSILDGEMKKTFYHPTNYAVGYRRKKNDLGVAKKKTVRDSAGATYPEIHGIHSSRRTVIR